MGKPKDIGDNDAFPAIIVEVDGSPIPFDPHLGDLLRWDGKYWQIARYKGVHYRPVPEVADVTEAAAEPPKQEK
jgi:hypothetical protein